MVHQAIKVEQQLKRRNIARRGTSTIATNSWRPAPKRDEFPSTKSKFEPSKDVKLVVKPKQDNTKYTISRNRDIKCFKCQGRGHIASQCPNKRVMVMRDNGEIETDVDSDNESMPSLEDADD